MRGLILALQFLTRIPTPQVRDFRPEDLSGSAAWFPLVGLLIGALVAAALALGTHVDPWLGALIGVLAWVGVTGALHLDGLADLADALGATHRDPQRFLEVLRDPHVGTFGVIALVLAVAAKLVLLMLVARQEGVAIALVLIPAWARFGAVTWSQTLPPLSAGSGERFAWNVNRIGLLAWGAALLLASVLLAPVLAAAPVALALWWLYLKLRLGGMTGDCLGAGIEVVEIALLATLAISAA